MEQLIAKSCGLYQVWVKKHWTVTSLWKTDKCLNVQSTENLTAPFVLTFLHTLPFSFSQFFTFLPKFFLYEPKLYSKMQKWSYYFFHMQYSSEMRILNHQAFRVWNNVAQKSSHWLIRSNQNPAVTNSKWALEEIQMFQDVLSFGF